MPHNTDIIDSMCHGPEARKLWMGTLARATTVQLSQALADANLATKYDYLRPPEVGLVMVRGRAEGKGQQFNLGEMTITRCTVKTSDGFIGHGYVAGRDKAHAELAAIFDALLQSPGHGPTLFETVIDSLHQEQKEKRQHQAAKTAATKVNFFTMVRGEN